MPSMTDTKTPKTPKTAPKGAAVVGKRKTDWEAVERDYRTGKFTLRELDAKHGAKYSSIARKAKQEGWTQDLGLAIKQATQAKLTNALVSNIVNTETQNVNNVIQTAADINTRIILGHRTGLSEITNIKEILLGQIKQAALNMPELEAVIEMVRNPDDNGTDKANDALRKSMSRSALVDDLKKLAEIDERVRKGEREAFSIDDAPPPGGDRPKRVLLNFVDVIDVESR